jgi:hypothetical protein
MTSSKIYIFIRSLPLCKRHNVLKAFFLTKKSPFEDRTFSRSRYFRGFFELCTVQSMPSSVKIYFCYGRKTSMLHCFFYMVILKCKQHLLENRLLSLKYQKMQLKISCNLFFPFCDLISLSSSHWQPLSGLYPLSLSSPHPLSISSPRPPPVLSRCPASLQCRTNLHANLLRS